MRRIHAVVTGRVQGVSYRVSTQKKALKLGLTGWVRNLSSGDVEFEAQGSEIKVEQLLKWARKGPFFAKVNNLSSSEMAATETDLTFRVRY